MISIKHQASSIKAIILFVLILAFAGKYSFSQSPMGVSSTIYDGWIYHYKPLSLGVGSNTGYHGSMLNLITKDSNNVYIQFLHILNTGSDYFDGVKIGLDEQTGIGFVINQQENSYIKLLTNNIPRMIITSLGNVGIGTMSPSATLHVNGSFMLQDGTQGQNKVLISDNNGFASWHLLQLSLNNNVLSVTGGSSVDLSQYLDNTDNQTLSVTNGNELTISNGNTVTIDVNDADSDLTNELQTLTVSNGMLMLSGNNSQIPLTSLNYWQKNGDNVYYNQGFVGIGTDTPVANLQIYDDNYYDNQISIDENALVHSPVTIGGSTSSLTQYAYASLQLTNKRTGKGEEDGLKLELRNYNAILNLQEQGNINFEIKDKTPLTITPNGEIKSSRTSVFLADKNGANSYSYAFLTRTTNPNVKAFAVNNGSGDKFVIYGDGRVGIGTQPVGGYMLSVKGNIVAERLDVKLDCWPDYVFESDYKLISLDSLRNFVFKNKHLPEVPTEEDVVKNGLDVGEMTKALIKKTEEMTLYIIQLNEKYKDLESKYKALEEKLKKYENQ